MRISIVPAQITTVEDKIAGNISVQQGILLGIPLLFGFIIALVFPPSGQFVAYKIAIVITLFAVFGSMAVRIKERIIAQWLKLFAIYCARPLYYAYDKNTTYLRNAEAVDNTITDEVIDAQPLRKPAIVSNTISSKEFMRLEQFAADARTNIRFEIGKKGELNVHITEAK